MLTVIQDLAQFLSQCSTVTVTHEENAMLVRILIDGEQRRTVKVTTRGLDGARFLVHLQSRACPVTSHATVREALKLNADAECGGLALDTNTNPPILDVLYSLVGDQMDYNQVLGAVHRVAVHACKIAQMLGANENISQ